jgi:nucleoside-diphosphate-sugar epimerase
MATTSSAQPGFQSPPGCVALVTGSSGLVGARLVEMLLERGAKHVIGFDVLQPDKTLEQRFAAIQNKTGGTITILSQTEGDLTNDAAVEAAFTKAPHIDIVYHIAAIVGPFHAKELYHNVNYLGTVRIIENCKKYKVPKLVFSSSPSTRFTGADVQGLREDQMPIPDQFLALYAETKAMGEKAVHKACCDSLLTISVAPHQVYGPYDSLFLPKLLETAGTGRLRIFGNGQNQISVCYNDNYCHGLMCGGDALYKGSSALAKYYVVHDGPPVYFWTMINEAVVAMGFVDLTTKFHLPGGLLYTLAYICAFFTFLTGIKTKLNPFTVKMLMIHRYFSLDNATKDLKYTPVVPHEEAWSSTIEWFQINWLPRWKEEGTSSLDKK